MNEYEYKEPAKGAEVDIELIIPNKAFRKIMDYAAACDTEISGFADVKFDKILRTITVGEVYLLEQNAGGADVHMDEEDVAKFNLAMIKKGKKQLPQLWWHSHVNMGVFFSGTDENTSVDLQNDNFSISLVVNKREEYKAKMYIYEEKISTMFGETTEEKGYIEVDPLTVTADVPNRKIPAEILKEVKDKVNVRPLIPWKNPFIKAKKGKKGKRGKIQFDQEENIGYEYEFGARYNHIKEMVYRLPKDKETARLRIKLLGLEKKWDSTIKEFLYINPNNKEVWVDYWEVLGGGIFNLD